MQGIDPEEHCEIPEGTCLLAYRGSIAHGMYVPDSDPNSIDDVDLMGVVLAGPEHYLGLREWGSRGTYEYKRGKWDGVFYEIRKMFSLLLQGNPNVMSLLWCRPQDYLMLAPAGKAIIENRHLFVGRHVYEAFAGYASGQLEKMSVRDPEELRQYLAVTAELKHRGTHPNHKGEHFPAPDRSTGIARDVSQWSDEKLIAALRRFQKKGENIGYLGEKRKRLVLEHGFDAKNAAHCIRLLRMCREFLSTGELQVFRPDADELLQIKRGEWTLEQIKTHAEDLMRETREACDRSQLPPEPDRAGAERLLIRLLGEHLAGQML